MKNKLSLRLRIFISILFLVLLASILIAAISVYQYKQQTEDYHERRLERKEEAIKSAISYELNRNDDDLLKGNFLSGILDKKINEISDIHNLDINLYNLEGALLLSSHSSSSKDTANTSLSKSILDKITNSPFHRTVLPRKSTDGKQFTSSFSYLDDVNSTPIGIIGVPYLQDNTFQDEELISFLKRLSIVYLLILLIAVVIAYFLSKYITKPIEYISNKMRETALDKTNKKIILKESSQEIYNLVNAYNVMIDQLEDSAVQLAKIERKQAWREMAKQVAHEIKNPLTPMRLTVQSFEHKFDPKDPNIKQKLHEYSESLIQQIDTMSSIASAFSNFAEMPTQKREALNVVQQVKLALDIFHEEYIDYHHDKNEIIAKLDKIQLTRVITNLITNAIHASKDNENPKILVTVSEANTNVIITVLDNGTGILDEDKDKIFEPKFTTKSSGMGLGLPIVKNIVETYNGIITFESQLNKGTVFTVTLPLEKP
ncbi:MAG: ATP-binding protein [Flavobacteriaceae bacterium]|nr:ATP-binding protein [Flavobacteriaceae bacterium]